MRVKELLTQKRDAGFRSGATFVARMIDAHAGEAHAMRIAIRVQVRRLRARAKLHSFDRTMECSGEGGAAITNE